MDVRIYDAEGALVRAFDEGVQRAGAHQLVWQGVDNGGRVVASGVYFWEVSVGGAKQSQKFFVLR